MHPNDSPERRLGTVVERALVEEVASGVGGDVVLAGVVVEVLIVVPEVEAEHVAVRAGPKQSSVEVDAGDRSAEAHVQVGQRVLGGESVLAKFAERRELA